MEWLDKSNQSRRCTSINLKEEYKPSSEIKTNAVKEVVDDKFVDDSEERLV